jgi:dephospho-CoA kinase
LPDPSLIGLTGGIAAGKSEALRILGELGAETVSSDALVHDLLATREVVAELTARWGEEVAPGGELDRSRVGAIVFADAAELEWLEALLHPRVRERIAEWRRSLPDDAGVAVVEVPLLFEGDLAPMFHATLAIVAADGERARRAEARGLADLEARSSRQLSQEEKARRATWVITNDDGLEQLRERLAELLPELEGVGR